MPRSEGEGNGGEDEEDVSEEENDEYDSDAPAGLLKSLQDVRDGVDTKMEYSSMRLFKGSKAVQAANDSDDDDDSDEDENEIINQLPATQEMTQEDSLNANNTKKENNKRSTDDLQASEGTPAV